MRIRVLATLAMAVSLSVAACTTDSSQSSAPRPAPSPSASSTSGKCGFLQSTLYVGQPEDRVSDIKALGWTVNVHYTETPFGAPQVDHKAISSVTGSSDCLAIVEVALPSPVTSTSTSPTPAGPLTTVTDGTYLVGTDMEPGSYKSAGSTGCYWARMKDDAGSNIIANNLGDGPARFTAKKGEYVQIARCTFTKT